MEFHEMAEIFPLMQGDEYYELVEDIADHGLLEPIWTYEGKILDGRNRYRACEDAGVTPDFRIWENGSPLGFVLSMNLKRRQLTKSQCAMIAVDVLPLLEAEAKARQRGGQGGVLLTERLPEANGESRNNAGKALGVSGRMVSDAKAIREKEPELARVRRRPPVTHRPSLPRRVRAGFP